MGQTKRHIICWTLFDFANSSYSAVIAAVVFPVYYAYVIVGNAAGVGDLWWGRAISLSMAIVALSSPFLGGIADAGGLRKRFLFIYTALSVLSVASLAILGKGMILEGFLLIVAANLGMEGGLVFYNSFLPRIAPREYQGRVSAWGFMVGYAGSIISLLLAKRPARGSAEQIEITSESRVSLRGVLFTTCPADNVAWEISARNIELDINGGVGRARGVKLDFKGVPILYAPYLIFPINNERKSGFLTADISRRDRTGIDLTVPYYLNLAPNYDLKVEPRYMSKPGTQVRSDFRYLLPNGNGAFGFEYLPDDDETQSDRRYVNLRHESLFGAREQWQLLTGIEEVSDDIYFEDLGSSLSITSQTHLNRFLDLNFFAPNWSVLTRFQNYQTIDTVLTDEQRPYAGGLRATLSQ